MQSSSKLLEKYSRYLKPAELQAIADLAHKIRVDPLTLLSVMWNESGLNPHAYEPRYGGSGLIGFMPSTLRNMGLTEEEIKNFRKKGVLEQLPYVERFYKHLFQRVEPPGKYTAPTGEVLVRPEYVGMYTYLPKHVNDLHHPIPHQVLFDEKYYNANPLLGRSVGEYIQFFEGKYRDLYTDLGIPLRSADLHTPESYAQAYQQAYLLNKAHDIYIQSINAYERLLEQANKVTQDAYSRLQQSPGFPISEKDTKAFMENFYSFN
jgi:hypothetical protein